MTHPNLLLATLVGSRICHDLISPVGAINNGLELMMMGAPGGTSPELDLITQSVDSANARVRLFRIAFGIASEAQKLGAGELSNILRGVYSEGRLTVDWTANGDVPRSEVQAIFLAVLCCETALPLGGVIKISDDQGQWHITAHGKRIDTAPALWGPLSTGTAPDDVTPGQVQFALLPACLAQAARSIAIDETDDEISIRF